VILCPIFVKVNAAMLQVWLPLQPKDDKSKNKGFLSKRIMLPFAVDIYPLGMFSDRYRDSFSILVTGVKGLVCFCCLCSYF